ncbi:hypothetical protein OAI08_04435 [Gammaproteobacteria bacterium]|nr:hypothetical protein [Betaproteobacteria bacterium]MDB4826113.1 hypothetical protein [Gammaproteobacteria bacterium]
MLKRLLCHSATSLMILVSMVALTLPCQVRADSSITVESAVQSDNVKTESLILGLTYPEAALTTAAVVGGVLIVNSLLGVNIGTTLAVLYVGHLIVEAGIVAAAAGGSLGLSWWVDTETESVELF